MIPPKLEDVRALGQKGAAEPFALGRIYGSRLSVYFTYLLARTPITPNGVTLLGISLGLVAGGLLWWPLSPLHLLSIALYQLSYILDFSDGELARLRAQPSQAGSYLDWLGHFYVPTLGAGMLGIQVGVETAQPAWLVLGLAATIGLGGFHFSCKEHIVIAYLRRRPEHSHEPEIQNAMLDRPAGRESAVSAPGGSDAPGARASRFLGSLLLYPGATHLLSLALLADLLMAASTGASSVSARQVLLATWLVAFSAHAVVAVRRNFRALKAVDRLANGPLPRTTSGPVP